MSLLRTATWSSVALLLVAPGAMAAYDVGFRFSGSAEPVADDPQGISTLLAFEAGQKTEWILDLTQEFTIVEIESEGGFAVARPWQLLPTLDDSGQHTPETEPHLHPHWFYPLAVTDVGPAGSMARAANVTGDGERFTQRLGIPGPGTVTLRVERDLDPPVPTLDAPQEMTHYGFTLVTHTDEPAYGDLRIAPIDDPDQEVPFPTTTPAYDQTFPVQGLDANTTYEVRVRFTDWSGNEAWSAPFQIRTEPLPDHPEPTLTIITPTDASLVPPLPARVEVEVSSPLSPVDPDGVRLFFDKAEVFDGFVFADGRLIWEPEGHWGPGTHSLSVEVRNLAGGIAVARWSFMVEEEKDAAAGAWLAVAAVAIAFVARGRRR